MNLTKVFYGDRRLKDMYVGATRWEVFKFKLFTITRRVVIASFFASVGGWIAGGAISWAYHMRPITVLAEKIVEVQSDEMPPVLARIMKCESSGSHLAKNGQIAYHVNSDGSIDLGAMEINSVHFAEASKLGFDLTKEKDNISFGKYLYANYGTEPWYSSKKCWSK